MASRKRSLKPHRIQDTEASCSSRNLCVNWEALAAGPLLSFHTGCIVGNTLYLHGGIEAKDSHIPSNKLHSLNLETSLWREINPADSPPLSHHASAVVGDRYIVLIGGWDGKVRTSKVFIFDTFNVEWIPVQTTGFHEQGGLSSHTATMTTSGEILVIGREGGLHMQRRHGDSYILTCDIPKRICTYREYTSLVSSRSGHTVSIVGNSAYIIGGRSDSQVERLTGFKGIPKAVSANSIFSKLSDLTSAIPPLKKVPCGRKNHVAVTGPEFILVYGGETFDGRNRDPVGDIFLVRVKPSIEWISVPSLSTGRAGHIVCSNRDRVIIHGGIGAKGQVCGDVRELAVIKH